MIWGIMRNYAEYSMRGTAVPYTSYFTYTKVRRSIGTAKRPTASGELVVVQDEQNF